MQPHYSYHGKGETSPLKTLISFWQRIMLDEYRKLFFIGALVFYLFILAFILMASLAQAQTVPSSNQQTTPATATATTTATATPITIAASNKAQQERLEAMLIIPTETGAPMPAPLQKSQVEISVDGPIARVTITQTYLNPTAHWLTGEYRFPLPEDSAIDRLTMSIGARQVTGEIQEKQAARKTFEAAVKAGKKASLLSQQRSNIFTTEVANIAPGERIQITIGYQQTVGFKDGRFDLRFPMVIRPRYNPKAAVFGQVNLPQDQENPSQWQMAPTPHSATINPPYLDPRVGQINPVSLAVHLNAGFAITGLESDYHAIKVTDNGDGSQTITLDETTGKTYAEQDFVLHWQPANGRVPQAGIFNQQKDDATYHTIMLVPAIKTQEDAEPLSDKAASAREVVFIIDTSGSMAGTAMEQARAALLMALDRLEPTEQFNIIPFSGFAYPLWVTAQNASPVNIQEAKQFVQSLTADGGTEMIAALDKALDGQVLPNRMRQVVFITDGSVGNEDALFQLIHQRLGNSRLFTVGISASPNSLFMTEAAEMGRGSYVYIPHAGAVQDQMQALFQKLERPQLTNIALQWPDGITAEAYPNPVADLYWGDPVIINVKTTGQREGDLIIRGSRNGQPFEQHLSLSHLSQNDGISKLWARAKITQLTRERRRGALSMEDEKAGITQVALNHGLISRYTSLVAVDKTPSRPQNAAMVKGSVASNIPSDFDLASGAGAVGYSAPLRLKKAMAAPRGRATTLAAGGTMKPLFYLIGILFLIISLWLARHRLINHTLFASLGRLNRHV